MKRPFEEPKTGRRPVDDSSHVVHILDHIHHISPPFSPRPMAGNRRVFLLQSRIRGIHRNPTFPKPQNISRAWKREGGNAVVVDGSRLGSDEQNRAFLPYFFSGFTPSVVAGFPAVGAAISPVKKLFIKEGLMTPSRTRCRLPPSTPGRRRSTPPGVLPTRICTRATGRGQYTRAPSGPRDP